MCKAESNPMSLAPTACGEHRCVDALVYWVNGNLCAGGALRASAAQPRMLRQLSQRSLDHVFRWIERAANPIASFGRRGVVGGGDRDRRFHRHAGTGASSVGVAGTEADPHREAAHDLRKIAGGIVGWDQRKLRPRGRQDCFDIAQIGLPG